MARKKVRVNPFRFLIGMGVILLIFWLAYQGISRTLTWMNRCSPTPEAIQFTRSAKGVVLREESRIFTQNSGTVGYYVQDGERVQAGQKIAEIIVTASSVSNTANMASKEVLDSEKLKKAALDIEIEGLMADIAVGVNSGELTGISSLKADLGMKLSEKAQLDNEIQALESGFLPESGAAGNAAAKAGQVVEIRSPGSGVVSFYSDGLEETLKPTLYRSIDLSAVTFAEPSGIAVPQIKAGDVLYKLVDSSVWYLVVPVTPGDRQVISQAQSMNLNIDGTSFQVVIKDAIEHSGKTWLVLESRGALADFHRKRELDVELMLENYPGLSVPTAAVVEKGDKAYVVRLDGGNRKTTVPVQIISRLSDRLVLSEGSFYTSASGEEQQIMTITKSDSILKKAKPEDIQ